VTGVRGGVARLTEDFAKNLLKRIGWSQGVEQDTDFRAGYEQELRRNAQRFGKHLHQLEAGSFSLLGPNDCRPRGRVRASSKTGFAQVKQPTYSRRVLAKDEAERAVGPVSVRPG
jgi:hypothetical protein